MQCCILQLIREVFNQHYELDLQVNEQSFYEETIEVLTQVVTNTTNNKNSGNAVLYENVKTIMSIRDSNNLKQLGYNILNKFMLKSSENNNNNNKFSALNLLKSIINED